jgi:hypothetical protein
VEEVHGGGSAPAAARFGAAAAMSFPSAGHRGAACGRAVELRRPDPSPAKIRVGGLEVTTTRMPGGAQFLHAAWLPRSQGARHDDDDDEVLLSVAGGPLSLLFLPRRPFPCSAARVGVVLSPASVAALSPTSDSVLSPTSGVCGGLPLDRWLGRREGAWARRHVRASRPNGTTPDLASPQPNATIPLLLASPGAAQKTPKATSRSLCRPDTGTSADSLKSKEKVYF